MKPRTKSYPGRKPTNPSTQKDTQPSSSSESINNEATIDKFLHFILSSTGSDSSKETPTKLDITQDVVKQVSKGPLGELLTFLGEHLVGRQEVRRVRRVIYAASSEDGVDGKLSGLEELEKARRRLRSARVAVDVGMKGRGEARVREGALCAFSFQIIITLSGWGVRVY